MKKWFFFKIQKVTHFYNTKINSCFHFVNNKTSDIGILNVCTNVNKLFILIFCKKINLWILILHLGISIWISFVYSSFIFIWSNKWVIRIIFWVVKFLRVVIFKNENTPHINGSYNILQWEPPPNHAHTNGLYLKVALFLFFFFWLKLHLKLKWRVKWTPNHVHYILCLGKLNLSPPPEPNLFPHDSTPIAKSSPTPFPLPHTPKNINPTKI